MGMVPVWMGRHVYSFRHCRIDLSPRGDRSNSLHGTVFQGKPPIGGGVVVAGMGPFVRGNHADEVGIAPQIPGRQFQNRVEIR